MRYQSPANLRLGWALGSLCLIFLMFQVITGLVLATHYVPEVLEAFYALEYIMWELGNGWFFWYGHAIGSSVFFLSLYVHMGRGLVYWSFNRPRHVLWATGVTLYLLVMMTSFLGYTLPWGQMSFWGVTVITGLVTALPIVGVDVAIWIWGGFIINWATIKRFFVLHFLLPFIIIVLSVYHILELHWVGSTTPSGAEDTVMYNWVTLALYYLLKDVRVSLSCILLVIGSMFFWPEALNHPINAEVANPLITPQHIVPEWYFLPFYAMLRVAPTKEGGIILMLSAILILYVIPYFGWVSMQGDWARAFKTPKLKFYKWIFSLLVVETVVLGFMGAAVPVWPILVLSQTATCIYFYCLLVN